jgi:hypothetical protein
VFKESKYSKIAKSRNNHNNHHHHLPEADLRSLFFVFLRVFVPSWFKKLSAAKHQAENYEKKKIK